MPVCIGCMHTSMHFELQGQRPLTGALQFLHVHCSSFGLWIVRDLPCCTGLAPSLHVSAAPEPPSPPPGAPASTATSKSTLSASGALQCPPNCRQRSQMGQSTHCLSYRLAPSCRLRPLVGCGLLYVFMRGTSPPRDISSIPLNPAVRRCRLATPLCNPMAGRCL